jgi:hypothetical protein
MTRGPVPFSLRPAILLWQNTLRKTQQVLRYATLLKLSFFEVEIISNFISLYNKGLRQSSQKASILAHQVQ